MRRPAPAELAITAGFAALFLVNLAHHAMWRDEMIAWLIALSSETPLALFRALHYDGHPGLWHMLLWPLTRLTDDPLAIKCIHGAIGLGIIALVGLVSPLTRLERVLVLAGYFVAFEYTVISRNYGIGMLLALLYAWRRTAAPEQVPANAVLLALMANTNVYAAMLSAALALEYLLARIALPGRGRLAVGALLYLAGLGLAIATVWPAPDISREITTPLAAAYSLGHYLKTLLRFVLVGLAPLRASPMAWEFALYPPERAPILELWPYLLALAALAGIVLWTFRRERLLLMVLGLTLFATVTFGHLVHAVGVRHWGVTYLAVLACLWMLRARDGRPSWLVVGVLALGTIGGAQVLVMQWTVPFSMGAATAQWIRAQGLADMPLIAAGDAQVTVVAGLLGREMTMVECRCTARRIVMDTARDGFRRETLPGAIVDMYRTRPAGPALLVSAWELSPEEQTAIAARAVTVTKLAQFTGSWVNEEFYLYRLAGGG